MNKTTKRILGAVIAIVLLGIVFYPKMDFLKADSAAAASGPPSRGGGGPMTVSAVVIEPTLLENKISVTGEILANESLDLKSEISGKVARIYFREGQEVKKGALLVKINVDELIAQREKIVYTQKLREDSELRQRQLLEREAISQEEYEQALNELQTNMADLKLVETQIRKSEIRAPFDGIIGLREISEGSYITPTNVIAAYYSINPIKVQFAIPGRYSTRVQKGSDITFSVDATLDIFNGKVYAIEPKLNPNTRTLTMRAICQNPGNVLLPGQFARVQFILDRKEDALMVPTQAVIPELDGTKVFLSKGGKVVQQYVKTGIRTDTYLEITEGLSSMDTVLTSGILQVRPGMEINVNLN
jgi:membrane fusion protein (multidrug efflux system)